MLLSLCFVGNRYDLLRNWFLGCFFLLIWFFRHIRYCRYLLRSGKIERPQLRKMIFRYSIKNYNFNYLKKIYYIILTASYMAKQSLAPSPIIIVWIFSDLRKAMIYCFYLGLSLEQIYPLIIKNFIILFHLA